MIVRLQDWYKGLRFWRYFPEPMDHCTCTIHPWCVVHDTLHEEV